MKKIMLMIIVTFNLTACGGGGGGESDSTQATPGGGSGGTSDDLETSSTDNRDSTILEKTTDLVAPEGFDFNPLQTRVLDVDVSAVSLKKAHLTVYSHFSELNGGEFVPVYNSKVLSAPLVEGAVSAVVTVSEANQQYLADIWFYDGSPSLQQIYNVTDEEWQWQ
ncbi:hypothetical protein [Thaumasiovibrio sp. DFM-14]|uniref:hypothetical protein n=1 Tax=Thaumasiovibrio sp. DFM-14 TaxID=3384792 RepID=UPI0039A37832